ncbi:MAG: TPM domain-containing protein [Chitinophagaceae bacterium]|nr:MAG: TPM domain-containing protein [Chitinophagaceae bacterium]
MGLLPFTIKKSIFTAEETQRIVSAIRTSEQKTSGEIRVFIEAKNTYVSPMDRAVEVFAHLKMEQTDHRNGVLLYIAHKHHEVALFADEGIYQKAGAEFWNKEVTNMIANFRDNHLPEGIIQCVLDVGEALAAAFPYIPTEDKNELPDDIVFGKL